MSILWGIAVAWLRGMAPGALGFLGSIPRWVWYSLAVLLAVMWFAHWNEQRGRALQQAEIAVQVAAEHARVQSSDADAVEDADKRANAAQALAQERQKELDDAILKSQAVLHAGDTVIPGNLADGLRHLR